MQFYSSKMLFFFPSAINLSAKAIVFLGETTYEIKKYFGLFTAI